MSICSAPGMYDRTFGTEHNPRYDARTGKIYLDGCWGGYPERSFELELVVPRYEPAVPRK